jgi:nicotinamide phosphoribosyltransferase
MNTTPDPRQTQSSPFNMADFYKTGHPGMYPEETTTLVANFTPRSAKHAPVAVSPLFDDKVVWFGVTGFIKEFLIETFNREFFAQPKAAAVRRYKRRMDTALGMNRVRMSHLEALHDLGYLPLEIRSLPEGSRVNIKVPPVVFVNTDPRFPWVSTYFETLFSCENWKPATTATIAFEFRKLLTYFARLTGSPEGFVPWQGHDFSMRGMSGVHDAARSGAGHLLSFTGTDTIPAIDYLEEYYGADSEKELVGGSVPATEHSVMTLRILLIVQRLAADPANAGVSEKALRAMAEQEVIRELVTEIIPSGVVSIVSDSFDFWNVITRIAPALKTEILGRTPDENGLAKVVFRPDSGDPVKILTGYRIVDVDDVSHRRAVDAAYMAGQEAVRTPDGQVYAFVENHDAPGYTLKRISAAEARGAVESLWETFGGTVTETGYRLLDPHVGLIYGDSITLSRAIAILSRLADKGYASANVVFGIGSYTYQVVSRDTFGFALKAIYAEVGGEEVAIFKDPATDDGTKKSAKGLLRVEREGNDFVLHEEQTRVQFEGGALVPVFRDGTLLVDEPLSAIRDRLIDSWQCPAPGSVKF